MPDLEGITAVMMQILNCYSHSAVINSPVAEVKASCLRTCSSQRAFSKPPPDHRLLCSHVCFQIHSCEQELTGMAETGGKTRDNMIRAASRTWELTLNRLLEPEESVQRASSNCHQILTPYFTLRNKKGSV